MPCEVNYVQCYTGALAFDSSNRATGTFIGGASTGSAGAFDTDRNEE